MATDDITKEFVSAASASAQNAVGFQVSKLVNMCVEGGLNILLGQSTEDKKKEMEEHYNKLTDIVVKNKIAPMSPVQNLSPREIAERDIREANDHISTAIVELEKAREKSKCGVCKTTINETIDFVSEKTGEILDTSEKVLALRKLKDVGEIPETAVWDDLTKKQKKLVEDMVEKYHPLTFEQQRAKEEEHVRETVKKRNAIRSKKRPQSSRRKTK